MTMKSTAYLYSLNPTAKEDEVTVKLKKERSKETGVTVLQSSQGDFLQSASHLSVLFTCRTNF